MIESHSPPPALHLFVPNLHCPSCVSHIQDLLSPYVASGKLIAAPKVSLLDRTVEISFANGLDGVEVVKRNERDIVKLLRDEGGFDIEVTHGFVSSSTPSAHSTSHYPASNLPAFLRKTLISRLLRPILKPSSIELLPTTTKHPPSILDHQAPTTSSSQRLATNPISERHQRHVENCKACLAELTQQEKSGVESGSSGTHVSSSSKLGKETDGREIEEKNNVIKNPEERGQEDMGKLELVIHRPGGGRAVETTMVIEGMTCSACTNSISSSLISLPGVVSHSIDLLSASARVQHDLEVISIEGVKEAIEDAGYGVEVVDSVDVPIQAVDHGSKQRQSRERGIEGNDEAKWTQVTLSIAGMTCSACSTSIKRNILETFSNRWIESSTAKHDGEPPLGMENFASADPVSAMKDVTIDPLAASGKVIFDARMISVEEIRECVEDSGYEVLGVDIVDPEPMQVARAGKISPKGKGKGFEEPRSRTVQIAVEGIFCMDCVNKLNAHLTALSTAATSSSISFTPFGPSPNAHMTSITYVPHSPHTIRDILASLDGVAPEFESRLIKPKGAGERGREIMKREREILAWHFGVALTLAVPTFVIAIMGMVILPGSNAFGMYWMHPIWGAANRGTVALWPIASVVQFGVGRLFYERAWRSLRPHLRALLPRKSATSNASRVTWKSFFNFGSMDLLVVLSTSVSYFASLAMLAMDVAAGPDGQTRGTFFDSCVFLIMFILGGRVLEAFAKSRTTSAIAELGQLRPAKAILAAGPAESMESDQQVPQSSKDSVAAGYVPPPRVTDESRGQIDVDLLDIGDLVILRPGDLPPADGEVFSGSSLFDEASLTGESRPVGKEKGDSVLSGTINLSSPIVMRVTALGAETMVERIIRAVSDASGKKASIEKLAERITGVFVPSIVYLALLVLSVWLGVAVTGSLPSGLLSAAGQARSDRVFFAFEFAIAVLVIACPCGVGLAAPCAQAVGMGMAAKAGILASGGGQAFQTTTVITDVVFDKTGTLTEGTHAITWSSILASNTHALGMTEMAVRSVVREVESSSSHPLAQALIAGFGKDFHGNNLKVDNIQERAGRGILACVTIDGITLDILVGNLHLLQESGYNEVDLEHLAAARDMADQGCSIVYAGAKRSGTLERPLLLGCWAISDKARPESKAVVNGLSSMGITTYMLTGDNAAAAGFMALEVGISPERVVAGVLPEDKGRFIQGLQGNNHGTPAQSSRRKVVLFVGDGLNDSVALASADVAVAMSHGSQAALASADFVLLNSDLTALLTAIAISRKVYRRQKLNFAWAILFNAVCIPFAAGAFYALHRIRLSPVWSAVAMALSSTSVVLSSLAMRWGI